MTGFRVDIVKIKAFPIFSQVEYQDIKYLNKKMHLFLLAELIPPPNTPTKSTSE